MRPPPGVWAPAAFFAIGGFLEMALAVPELPSPIPFWPLWGALGRSLLYLVLAVGLWHRLSLCRLIALVYCIASLITYLVALGLAFAHAPILFPPSVVWRSFYEVPSCALLLPYLRSERAAALYPNRLFGSR